MVFGRKGREGGYRPHIVSLLVTVKQLKVVSVHMWWFHLTNFLKFIHWHVLIDKYKIPLHVFFSEPSLMKIHGLRRIYQAPPWPGFEEADINQMWHLSPWCSQSCRNMHKLMNHRASWWMLEGRYPGWWQMVEPLSLSARGSEKVSHGSKGAPGASEHRFPGRWLIYQPTALPRGLGQM